MSPVRRVPRGVPTGGQFAVAERTESSLVVDDYDFVVPWDADGDQPTPRPAPRPEPDPEPAPEPDPEPEPAPRPEPDPEPGYLQAIADARSVVVSEGASAEAELAITAAGRAIAQEIDRRTKAGRDGFAVMRTDVTRTVLAEVREMGSVDGLIYEDTSKPAAALVDRASQAFPKDWIEAQNGLKSKLKIRYSSSRAHYMSAKAAFSTREFTAPAYFSGYHPPANVDAVESTTLPGWYSWRAMSTRTVKKLDHVFSEITVPSPNQTPRSSARTATHELSHRMEHAMPRIGELEHQFLMRRCTDTTAAGTRRTISAISGMFSTRERAWDGGFVDPYVGKIYKTRSHREVLSVGMEAVMHGSYGGLVGEDGYKADEDHRAFILGMLACA